MGAGINHLERADTVVPHIVDLDRAVMHRKCQDASIGFPFVTNSILHILHKWM
jgi:hypothetical protein